MTAGELETCEVLTRYAAGESAAAIAKSIGATKWSVLRLLHQEGVDIRPSAPGRRKFRPPRIDGFAASQLDDWHAYWLGFLTAHGSIQRSPRLGHRLTVALRSEDAGHLEALRDGLDTDAPIRPHHHGVALILINRDLCDCLQAWGVGTRESLPAVPLSNRRSALRGYWDAHGTVSGRARRANVNVVAGNDTILREVSDWLSDLGVICLGTWPLTGSSRMLAVSRRHENLSRLYEVLYGDECTVLLDRQRARLQAVLTGPSVER